MQPDEVYVMCKVLKSDSKCKDQNELKCSKKNGILSALPESNISYQLQRLAKKTSKLKDDVRYEYAFQVYLGYLCANKILVRL